MTTDVSAVKTQADQYVNTLQTQWTQFLGNLTTLLSSGIALNFDFGGTGDNYAAAEIPIISEGVITSKLDGAIARLYSYTPINLSFDGGTVPADIPGIGDATQALSIDANPQAAPSVTLPDAPTGLSVVAPGSPPELTDLGDTPAEPTLYDISAAPTFYDIQMPALETISFESFAGTDPGAPPEYTQTPFTFTEQPYTAALLTAVENKLLTDLADGGYGIDDDDEQRLWERARDREAQSLQVTIDEVARLAAARGFSYPPGVMYAMQQNAIQDYAGKNSSVSRDILSKKADLYVQNRQFTIGAARDVEALKMQFHTALMERALRTAQLTVEMGIAAYNASVTQFRAKVDFYRAQVEIWMQKRQAELYKVEVFKAQVSAEQAKAQINQALVDRYKAEISVVENQVRLFDTQIRAYRSRVDAQMALIAAFKNQVDVYRAQVDGKQLEVNVFKAQIDGEMAKVAAYRAQADAYNGYLNAKIQEASAKEAVTRTKVQNSQIQLEAYRTRLAKYQADLARDQAILNRDFANEALSMNAKTAQAQTLLQAANIALQGNKANIDSALEQLKTRANYVIASGNVWTSFLNMKSATAGAGLKAVQSALEGAFGMVSGITTESR